MIDGLSYIQYNVINDLGWKVWGLSILFELVMFDFISRRTSITFMLRLSFIIYWVSLTIMYIHRSTSTLLYIQIHHPLFLHYKNVIRSADPSADRADYQCRSRRQQHTAATMSLCVQRPHIDYQLDKRINKLWVHQCHTLQLSGVMCFPSYRRPSVISISTRIWKYGLLLDVDSSNLPVLLTATVRPPFETFRQFRSPSNRKKDLNFCVFAWALSAIKK